jgi:nitric oxide reductase subunit B
MVVHAIFDSGVHRLKNSNHPALAWTIAQAAGNFFGAGVWGFMHTLPQINLYTHGTQWTASHGHLAFFGAYSTAVIAFFYLAAQKARGDVWMSSQLNGAWKWKWAMALLWIGMVGMTMALLIAGYEQSQIERAIEGSSWAGYFAAQGHPWFVQAMKWRMLSGWAFTLGYVLLVWDLLTIGKRETRPALRQDTAEANA